MLNQVTLPAAQGRLASLPAAGPQSVLCQTEDLKRTSEVTGHRPRNSAQNKAVTKHHFLLGRGPYWGWPNCCSEDLSPVPGSASCGSAHTWRTGLSLVLLVSPVTGRISVFQMYSWYTRKPGRRLSKQSRLAEQQAEQLYVRSQVGF